MNHVRYPDVPQRVAQTRMFTFGAAFHFFVAGHSRHFKFSMWIKNSKSKPTDDKSSLK